ncbi:uncharacterized protein LOC115384425 [Salarias fasciatus]|uniref:uncharacterized protein LOC115384425 n=1 Tax=Salarias fasciatus TaxID=181472 RepID=UPI001176EAAE|nr:uncharacterized protein LOC115384425 [Salarias fasciatus]
MGYVCFKCKKSAGKNVRQFFSHLRVMHNVYSASTFFQCAQLGCQRSFNQIRSFRRHLLAHAIEFDISTEGEGSPATHPERSEEPEGSISDELEWADTSQAWDDLEEDSIKDRVALFLARLKSKPSQTYSAIRDVVEHTSSLVKDVVDSLKRKTTSFLRDIGQPETPECEELLQQFNLAAVPFKGFESEYKQMKYFTGSQYFVQPEAVPLPGFSYTQITTKDTGTVKQVAIQDTFQVVPLKQMLKLILESPGTMEKITEWRKQQSTALEDFRDGTAYQTNTLFSEEFSVPLLLYCDDCEMVNPLGSKTSVHKLGFIYYTLKCLPPEYHSSLKSHFLLAVYKTDDVKTYGINAILDPIVNKIKELEDEGIQINTIPFKVCADGVGYKERF